MKKLILLVVAITIIAMSGVAMAASTTVTVNATVSGTCKITSGAVTLGFGAIDPGIFADTTLSGSVVFWCTTPTAYTITLDGSQRVNGTGIAMNMSDGTNNLPFTLTPQSNPTGNGSGPGTPISYNVDATLTAAAVQAANASTYQKIIAVVIAP